MFSSLTTIIKRAAPEMCLRNSTLLSNSLRKPTNAKVDAQNESKVDPVAFRRMCAALLQTNKKIEEFEQRFERIVNESKNMSARLEKCVEEQKNFGIQSFSRDFLSVADNINYATAAVPKEQLALNPHLKNLYKDVCKTQKHLMRVLKKHGVRPMNPIHTKFDPHFHEAMFARWDESCEPNTVIEVIKCGYKLHKRCLRPALVGVSKVVDYLY